MNKPKLQSQWDEMYLKNNDSLENVSLACSSIPVADFLDAYIYNRLVNKKTMLEVRTEIENALKWYDENFNFEVGK
jgi:hypothetical protein